MSRFSRTPLTPSPLSLVLLVTRGSSDSPGDMEGRKDEIPNTTRHPHHGTRCTTTGKRTRTPRGSRVRWLRRGPMCSPWTVLRTGYGNFVWCTCPRTYLTEVGGGDYDSNGSGTHDGTRRLGSRERGRDTTFDRNPLSHGSTTTSRSSTRVSLVTGDRWS